LEVDEKDVFRPFLRVNNHQIGLGMALAQQILRRNNGMISFSKENPRRAQISILLKPCAE
jgi:nitrogen-specific signal transduction histidine kinase